MPELTTPEKYIDDVLNGNILVGQLVKLAVYRHVKDLENAKERGFYFSKKAAKHALGLFKFLKHSKGKWAGKIFDLEDWEQFIIWVIFGWHNKDKTRRFNYAYVEMAKKNGKTTFAAGIGLVLLVADGEAGAEVYTAANSRNQAKYCFNEAKNMVNSSPALNKIITVYQHNLHITSSASKMEPLSSDSLKQEGINPSGAIIDEYHAAKTSQIYDTIKSAMGARENPLIFIITTAGFRKDYPCFRLRKSCIDIVNGVKIQENMFVMIHTLDQDDDWNDPKVWKKANPNLGISPSMRFLKNEYKSAKNNGGEDEVNFKTKNLNMWVDAPKVWVKDEDWMRGNIEVDQQALIGRRCFIGLDLSEKYDICALVKIFPDDEDDWVDVVAHFWIPELKVIQKREAVDYRLWQQQGYVNVVEGNVIDDDLIIEQLQNDAERYDIRSLGYDEWNSKKFIVDLGKRGFDEDKLNKVTQYMSVLSEPTKYLYEKILAGKVRHGGNPVLRWMMGNVVLRKDTSGNIRIAKDKTVEKVDGISALINAFCEWMDPGDELDLNEIYKDKGLSTA